MKFLISLVVVVGLSLGAWQLYQYWLTVKDKEAPPPAAQPQISGEQLAGMPPSLDSALSVAEQRGATGLHDFLTAYGNTIADPRRAWIELDYVVLEAQIDPSQARRAFAKVEGRVHSGSPVYDRMKQLEKTYSPADSP